MRIKPSTIIKTFRESNFDASKTARLLKIHRATVYRWVKRARTPRRYSTFLRVTNLERRSTKPHRVHYSLSPEDRIDIVKLRENKGYDADKIKKILNLSVSRSTIHRFLGRKGLLRGYGFHRRPRFQDTVHMHAKNVKTIGYLQMDVKHITPELSGLPWTCFEYAVMDIYSRYKEALILNQLDSDGALVSLMQILGRLPFKPVFIQTDNGLEFQGKFREYVKEIGLKQHYIHKRSPNENAVIERSFRTDEEEFFFRMERAPEHYDELRVWFADYLYEYNHIRPHHGLDLKTPAEVVANVMRH